MTSSPFDALPMNPIDGSGASSSLYPPLFVSLPANTVMLDEMTLRHMVQDCTAVKTQLLKMKRILHQVSTFARGAKGDCSCFLFRDTFESLLLKLPTDFCLSSFRSCSTEMPYCLKRSCSPGSASSCSLPVPKDWEMPHTPLFCRYLILRAIRT